MPQDKEPEDKTSQGKGGHYLGLGVAIGTAVGVATGNLALWLSLGLAIGAALMANASRGKGDEDDRD